MVDSSLRLGEWLRGDGPESDIVISSRIRIARNVVGFPLKARLSSEHEGALCSVLRKHVTEGLADEGLEYQDLQTLDEIDRLLLVERHLISLDHANASGARGVMANDTGSLALMLNEEDHLRIQVLGAGLSIDELFERTNRVGSSLESVLDFAFHPRFGYLTSCPTNVGTGMRISVMLHLPALMFSKQIEKVFNAVSRMNLAVRGFYGEGTKALSDFYQISNQVTLGQAPEKLLESVRPVLPKIVRFEREVRDKILSSERVVLEDRIWRAYGTLTHARSMSSDEAFQLLSMIRMGVHLGLLRDLEIEVVNQLFLMSQPGHLQKLHGEGPLEQKERDVVRAQLIRERLAG